MVECTGLENRQSRKVLVGSNPTASARQAIAPVKWAISLVAALAVSGCLTWRVPGETQTSGSRMRAVGERVLEAAAKERPGCRRQNVTDTQIVELHPDAKVELERWTVTGCGDKMTFLVRFPPTGRGTGFLVQRER